MVPLKHLHLLSRYKLLKGATGLPWCGLCYVVKAVGPGEATLCSDPVKDTASFLGFECMWKEGKMESPLVKEMIKLNFGGIPAVQKQPRLAKDLKNKNVTFL